MYLASICHIPLLKAFIFLCQISEFCAFWGQMTGCNVYAICFLMFLLKNDINLLFDGHDISGILIQCSFKIKKINLWRLEPELWDGEFPISSFINLENLYYPVQCSTIYFYRSEKPLLQSLLKTDASCAKFNPSLLHHCPLSFFSCVRLFQFPLHGKYLPQQQQLLLYH